MMRRTYLFVPGNRPYRFEKAWQSGAHAVILDLEDAVQGTQKDLARENVASWLSPERPVARGIVEVAEASGAGALQLDGELVD